MTVLITVKTTQMRKAQASRYADVQSTYMVTLFYPAHLATENIPTIRRLIKYYLQWYEAYPEDAYLLVKWTTSGFRALEAT